MNHLEIEKFIRSYCEAYKPGNAKQITTFFHYPASFLASGTIIQVKDCEECRSLMEFGLSQLSQSGYSQSRITQLYIHELSDDFVIVSAAYSRLKSNGALLENVGATYTLLDQKHSGWKIISAIGHDISSVISR